MAATASAVQLTPEVFRPLRDPGRYKVMYGGRGGAKSWNVARELLILGSERPMRILCCREIQRSIKESVLQLLKDQIEAMGLESFYTVTEKEIKGRNGTLFSFTGLRSLSVANIKSYEGYDIAWVEEAHVVSRKSWSVLIPTIRKEGSQIWVTFNPELDTDETWMRFVENTPPKTWVQSINYRDNPFFPQVLEDERLHAKASLPKDEYDNIWEGKCRLVMDGAIYASEVVNMIQGQQVRMMPYDPNLKVHTVWDLGWNDSMVILFVQRLHSEVRMIHYIEDDHRKYSSYAKEVQDLDYVYGSHWLPHDGDNESAAGPSARASLKALGLKNIKIVPKLGIEIGIKAVRMLLPRLFIDNRDLTQPGQTGFRGAKRMVGCLKRYRRNIPTTTDEPSTPRHDEYSHGCDAIRYLATIVDKLTNEEETGFPTGIHVSRQNIKDPGMGY